MGNKSQFSDLNEVAAIQIGICTSYFLAPRHLGIKKGTKAKWITRDGKPCLEVEEPALETAE